MTLRRLRWYVWLPAGVMLTPLVLWLLLILVLPTAWAKRTVVAALEARSGRPIRMERLSLCPMGGIHLVDLEIGSPQSVEDPWLKAGDVRLDVSVLELFRGRLQPTSLQATDVNLRLFRRADGSFEIADLIEPKGVKESGAGTRSVSPRARLVVQLHRAMITVIDEPTHTRMRIEDAEGSGYREGRQSVLEQLRGTVNGGTIRVAGRVDRTSAAREIEAQIRAEDVELDDGMNGLRYLVPVLAGTTSAVRGKVHADLSIRATGETGEELKNSVDGHGEVSIKPIDLTGSQIVAELSKITDLTKQQNTAAVRTDFVIKERRISTDHFTMTIGRLPVLLAGWTDFDGQLDYRIKVEGLADRLPQKARRLLGDLDLKIGSVATLALKGDVNRMAVQLNGVPLDGSLFKDVKIRKEDRDKLRSLGRALRDELFR
jgi:AsmA protein